MTITTANLGLMGNFFILRKKMVNRVTSEMTKKEAEEQAANGGVIEEEAQEEGDTLKPPGAEQDKVSYNSYNSEQADAEAQ